MEYSSLQIKNVTIFGNNHGQKSSTLYKMQFNTRKQRFLRGTPNRHRK